MNKTIIIIAITIAIIFGAGYLVINTNPDMKAQAIKLGIIEAPQPLPVPTSCNSVFIVFDPSSSGTTTFSVPRISTEFISLVIEKIQSFGSGEVWLTPVDMNGSNNKVLHFFIPKTIKVLLTPERGAGELKGDFDKRIVVFRTDSLKKVQEIDTFMKTYGTEKDKFLNECRAMIDVAYGPKKKGTDYSDVIASINSGIRSLETIPHDTLHFRSLLLISDGEQKSRWDTPKQELNKIQEDIMVISVNNSGSKNNVVAGKCIELDNLDRSLEKIIQFYKP